MAARKGRVMFRSSGSKKSVQIRCGRASVVGNGRDRVQSPKADARVGATLRADGRISFSGRAALGGDANALGNDVDWVRKHGWGEFDGGSYIAL